MDGNELVKVIVVALIGGTVFMSSLAQIWFAHRRKLIEHERELPPQQLGHIDRRLERLELAVEAVAVEVERIAEAHRYTAKLLAERLPEHQAELPRPTSRPGASITPH
jgi:hypothetical protein